METHNNKGTTVRHGTQVHKADFLKIPKRQNSQKSPPSFDRPIPKPYGDPLTS